MIAAKISETDFGVTAVIVVLVLVLGYRLLRRDSGIRLTRIGIFLERNHYEDEEPKQDDDTSA